MPDRARGGNDQMSGGAGSDFLADDGMVGLVQEAIRLDPRFDRAFFAKLANAC